MSGLVHSWPVALGGSVLVYLAVPILAAAGGVGWFQRMVARRPPTLSGAQARAVYRRLLAVSYLWPLSYLLAALMVDRLGWFVDLGLAPAAVWAIGLMAFMTSRINLLIPLLAVWIDSDNIWIFVGLMAVLLIWRVRAHRRLKAAAKHKSDHDDTEDSSLQPEVDAFWVARGFREQAPLVREWGAGSCSVMFKGRDLIFLKKSAAQGITADEQKAILWHEVSHAIESEWALWPLLLSVIIAQGLGLWLLLGGSTGDSELLIFALMVLATAAYQLRAYRSERRADRLAIEQGYAEPLYRALLKLQQGRNHGFRWMTPGWKDSHGQAVKRQLFLGWAAGVPFEHVIDDILRASTEQSLAELEAEATEE